MKNTNLIFQVVLALAVAGLYVLHFTNKGSNTPAEARPLENLPPPVTTVGPANLAFVNIDTLLDNYSFYNKLRKEFESKHRSFESEIDRKKSDLESEFSEVQQKAQAGHMTQEQMAMAEEKLMMKQQELLDYKNDREEKLADENVKMNKELYSRISDYLKKVNADANYQFIFSYTREGGILLANDSLDITRYVLKGLNDQFENEKMSNRTKEQ